MTITVNRGETLHYFQETEDNTTLNATVAHLMTQPRGDKLITKINNNGHELVFRTETLETSKLIRVVNGIVTRTKK
jgi:hypothetical protein